MSVPSPPTAAADLDDHQVSGLLAQEAAELLNELKADGLASRVHGYRLQAQADRAAHLHLVDRLETLRPEDMVLSEEGRDDRRRLDADRVWIIDPLDGSQDFGRRHSQQWAVHVALCVDGRPVAGAVSIPAAGQLFCTNVEPISNPPERDRPVVITSRSQWGDAEDVAAAIDAEVWVAGSAGFKAMAVVAGLADVYVHPSGLYEWDVCAPAVVAEAAGFDVSGVDGSTLRFNKPRPVVPGLLVSRPEFTDAALGALRW